MGLSASLRQARWLANVGLIASVASGCAADEAPSSRDAGPGLGSEIFGVLCERVGAQALREDLTGASYTEICHGDATKVDTKRLPPAAEAQVRARNVATVEALASHRAALVAALDVVFPDDKVVGRNLSAADPIASCDPVSEKPRRDQLRDLLARLLPTGEDDAVPESSRAVARSLEPLLSAEGQPARVAMTHLAARRGYMPPELSAGLLGAMLTAPRLRDTLGATMHLFSPEASPFDAAGTVGTGHAALQRFLVAAQGDLTAKLDPDPAPETITFDAASRRTFLARPRTAVELARELLLAEDPAFSDGPSLFVARRDARGVAVVAKVDGKLPAPFIDKDRDGLPDLDALGRFVTSGDGTAHDPFVGVVRDPAYEYVDARATAASAVLRHMSALADPDRGHESVFASLEGLEPLLREREALLDLVHAGAEIVADPASDDLLGLVAQLLRTQPELIARVTGDLLDAKATLDAHPEAALPKGSTLVDDVLDVLVKISRVPGLLEDVLLALADDRMQHVRTALPSMLSFRDRMSYDRAALNGLPANLTTGRSGPPETPVDRTKPSTGQNRSIFQRYLQLIHDSDGVTACSKPGGILHATFSLDAGATYSDLLFPFQCTCEGEACTCVPPAPECSLLKIEDLSSFYLRSIAGQATLHFRSDVVTPLMSPDTFRRSTGLDGFWDTPAGQDVKPRPELLNRLVFFDVQNDSPNAADRNHHTNYAIGQLQGAHIGSSACAERTIDDPNVGDPDVAADGKIHGLRTCQDGQYFDQRNADTIFALEYNHGYDALAPLVEAFVKHGRESMFVDLLTVLDKHWQIAGGVVRAEPALAEIFAGGLPSSLVALAKATNPMTAVHCATSSTTRCNAAAKVDAPHILAEGLRALVDPAWASRTRVATRKGSTELTNGRAVTGLGLLRAALDAADAVLDATPAKRDAWLRARSHIVDELFAVKGRGADARFVDAGVTQIATVIVDVLRSQRLAKCAGVEACPALREQLAPDIEGSLASPLTASALDLLDAILADEPARRELGRMASYLTAQGGPLAGAGAGAASPSSTPFTSIRGPGALDQSIAALVDALGAIGDLREIRPFYPMLAHALADLDPQLSLLSRLSARAYDGAGHEICARELDPEEAIPSSLSRLARPIDVPGEPTRTALQIFLEASADVNRLDPARKGPLDANDYANVLDDVHALLTDPTSGLEQLYASVRNATAKD